MIISAWPIRKPRISRLCLLCGKLILTGPQIRLYGAAHKTDPPYVMYVHPQCVDATGEPKINKALEDLFKKNNLTGQKTIPGFKCIPSRIAMELLKDIELIKLEDFLKDALESLGELTKNVFLDIE